MLGAEALCRHAEQAVSWLARAVMLDPASGVARSNLGEALRRSGSVSTAATHLARAAELAPTLAEAHGNLGLARLAADQIEDSSSSLRRAISLDPANAAWMKTLADAEGEALALADAERWLRRALAVDPTSAEAHFNLAWTLLAAGDYAAGFGEYEWRLFLTEARPSSKTLGKVWHGEPLAGAGVRLLAEQGYGDTLQFIRFAKSVAARGGLVVAESRSELAELVATVPGVARVVGPEEESPDCTWHVAMTSLPFIFQVTPASLPGPVPYMTAPTERVEAWRRRLAPLAGLRVGLCWRGNPQQASDARRSPGLSTVRPLLRIEEVSFVGLVKQPTLSESTDDLALNAAPECRDFADTAAVLANLDLVITSDTSVAHLAGALGRPVWILLCHAPDWRWMLDRADSPWYPSARLYRQARRGDWGSAVRRLADDLRDLAGRNVSAERRQ